MQKLINFLVIFSLLFHVGVVSAQKQNPTVNAQSENDLFRTWVKVADELDLTKLNDLGAVVVSSETGKAQVIVNADALEQIARLGFQPNSTEIITNLVSKGVSSATDLSLEDIKAVDDLMAVDDDDDGLTNTQESWWCTDPLDADSDDDGILDGVEIQTAKDWMANRQSGPAFDSPWASWPFNDTTCPDKDMDSIPNLAERWELGLNMDLESTDRDKFDDGQELFGVTYCPGGDASCGYGDLPRSSDTGYVGQTMPSWVKVPGNHPLVTAHPMTEIDVVPSSLHVETVTIVTTDHVITSGTERSFSTAKTEGISTSVANTTTWNNWEEVSLNSEVSTRLLDQPNPNKPALSISSTFVSGMSAVVGCGGTVAVLLSGVGSPLAPGTATLCVLGLAGFGIDLLQTSQDLDDYHKDLMDSQIKVNQCNPDNQSCSFIEGMAYSGPQTQANANGSDANNQNKVVSSSNNQYYVDSQSKFLYQRFYNATYPKFVPTVTNTEGQSWGGSQTNTTEQYEEHTITNGEAFSNQESWGTAVAVDSAHAADFWFSYKVKNNGTDYAREITNLAFNIYLNDNPNPIITYFVGPDLGGDGVFRNFQPEETHTYTSRHIPLTLEQMKQIDLGGTLRIVVEDFSFGTDELFYSNALNGNVQLAIEDGTEDGNETIDRYLIPAYAGDTVIDVMARYFPYAVDEDGNLNAIWTPEYRQDVPAWCADSQVVGAGANQTVWCKHSLTTADWWNIYTDNLGDGSLPLQETPVVGGSTALFRFNADSDFDGYSDRSEVRLGSDPYNAADFPRPELLAGVHSNRTGDQVVSTLSLLNTGLYDAYGVEAVMIAPDDSITITNNTVGGSGRVRSGKEVVVGSRILTPTLASWTGTSKPAIGGYYNGVTDKTYTFTVACSNPAGCPVGAETWSLSWSDGTNTGSVNFGTGYQSPSLVNIGNAGLKLGLVSGTVFNGNTFTIEARTPRDTFQYTINREPYTEPIVIVSYNDPQGNHRFMIPEGASDLVLPSSDLLLFSGQMLDIRGVEIVTSAPFNAGVNNTYLVVDNPSGKIIQDAHLFLEFIDPLGTVVAEVVSTQNLTPGPGVVEMTWDTTSFDPQYDPDQDYIVMAFWTDYEGNILDVVGRPLSSFQQDPQAKFAMSTEDSIWDFGSIPQGSLLKKTFTFANTGERELLTYVETTAGLSVSQLGSREIGVADQTSYEIMLNTEELAEGAFEQTVTIHTSDSANATRTVFVTGTITAGMLGTLAGSLQRPLDYMVTVPGPQSQGTWYSFEHPIGPEPQTIHPVKVYSEDYSQLWGVGKYATQFENEIFNYDIFGNGSDGDLVVNTGQTYIISSTKNFNNVTIKSGGIISVSPWNGSSGGIVNFKVKETLLIEAGGKIDVSFKGYRGGLAGHDDNNTQGEGYLGLGTHSSLPNANGGGGGHADTGGGGGYGSVGIPGYENSQIRGQGGLTVGPADLSTIYFGGGGGGGGSNGCGSSRGGVGGGAIVIYSKIIQNYGNILSNGENAPNACERPGGGGAGGAIKLVSRDLVLGNNTITALGGSGGYSTGTCPSCFGGSGGVGRIRVEAQNITGNTSPNFSRKDIYFYIAEQSEITPYTITHFNIPETLTTGKPYAIQFGRRMLFLGESDQTGILSIPASLLSNTTLDTLISGVGTGSLTLTIDIGDDNSSDFIWTGNVTDSVTLDDIVLTQAFNRWWVVNGKPTSGDMDVPVKVSLSKAGQVFLTDLKINKSGSVLRNLRLEDGRYDSIVLDYIISGASGPITIGLDVGDDGTVDDNFISEIPSNPQTITSGNLSDAINAYLDTVIAEGDVDIPIRFYLPSEINLQLDSFNAVKTGTVDLVLSATDIQLPEGGSPTEGTEIPVSVTLHNIGSLPSGRVVASFYATAPGWGEWYIGSQLVDNIPPEGNATAQINWKTLGFNGSVPVRVVIDPYNRLSETNEENNSATSTYTIFTRPDLSFNSLNLSDPEPLSGQTVQVSLPVNNGGQTSVGSTTVKLYNGNPNAGGILIGEQNIAVAAEDQLEAIVNWEIGVPGFYRLFAIVDDENLINESLEGNNLYWKDIHVGFATPLILNSGILNEDPVYSLSSGYGFIDSGLPDVLGTCSSETSWENSFRRDPDGLIEYQFDHLQPNHFYHLDLVIYECDSAGRQESITVDGMELAGPIDLGDGQVHRISLRLDPALYRDHQISVQVSAPGADGVVVSAVNLHDIDYRYADSGGGNDPQYPGTRGFGWLDGNLNISYGTLPYQSGRVDPDNNTVQYRFDNLLSEKEFDLDFTFWQSLGTGRIQKIKIDGVDSGVIVDTSDYLIHRERIPVPTNLYQTDGSVVVSVERTNATTGAMVNEIALEERTIFTGQPLNCDHVRPTPYFTDSYGYLTHFSLPGQIGQRVEALNPRGEVVGCYIVDTIGQYGFMRVYGEDTSTNPITPGMRSSEKITYRVSGFSAYADPDLYFQDDHVSHFVNLEVRLLTEQTILLNSGWNLISFNVESPAPLVPFMLGTLSNRVDRLVGEYGVYSPVLPAPFVTLKEIHSGKGFYVLVNGTTSVNWVVSGEPVPNNTVFDLHAGWNWIGGIKESMAVETALSSIAGKYRRVISLTKSFDTSVPPSFNTLVNLIPGEGYLIYMTEAGQLVYPYAAQLNTTGVEIKKDVLCGGVQPTPRLSIVYGNVFVNGMSAPTGTQVEFITPRGEVAGCAVIEEEGLLKLTSVFGADSGVPGFESGETMQVRLNGVPGNLAEPLIWQDDKDLHQISVSMDWLKLFLPMVNR